MGANHPEAAPMQEPWSFAAAADLRREAVPPWSGTVSSLLKNTIKEANEHASRRGALGQGHIMIPKSNPPLYTLGSRHSLESAPMLNAKEPDRELQYSQVGRNVVHGQD